jgi:hypothetical protein
MRTVQARAVEHPRSSTHREDTRTHAPHDNAFPTALVGCGVRWAARRESDIYGTSSTMRTVLGSGTAPTGATVSRTSTLSRTRAGIPTPAVRGSAART